MTKDQEWAKRAHDVRLDAGQELLDLFKDQVMTLFGVFDTGRRSKRLVVIQENHDRYEDSRDGWESDVKAAAKAAGEFFIGHPQFASAVEKLLADAEA